MNSYTDRSLFDLLTACQMIVACNMYAAADSVADGCLRQWSAAADRKRPGRDLHLPNTTQPGRDLHLPNTTQPGQDLHLPNTTGQTQACLTL